jgi:hypothetical protein
MDTPFPFAFEAPAHALRTIAMTFDFLPDDARVWVFAASRDLSAAEQSAVTARIEDFLGGWTSHGRPVRGSFRLEADRLAVVAGELAGGVSGCGIDKLVHALEEAAAAHGFSWLDGLSLLYRDEAGAVRAVSRAEFRALARSGAVGPDTPVFDTTLTTLGPVRTLGVERPAGASWHAALLAPALA